MANPLNTPSPTQHQATADLMHRLIHPTVPYPWQPQDLATDDYYDALEADLPDDVIADSRASFWQNLDSQWQQIDGSPGLESTSLTALIQGFQGVPRQLLADIATQAVQLTAESSTLADRLVACVQQLFPQWSTDDLYVLARPYAYAMRSAPTDLTPQGDWENLSEVDRVRLTLAVAKAALELPSADD
ncbi:hypothetical protein [Prochlorothrix hollandica]|uniref:hypothetical protein n=1 Tax=Prochlorothrix hollandica TaxID=1223 RepID=UPI00034B408B|nr:hypothetical protein [Prochlorothrix hollandica]